MSAEPLCVAPAQLDKIVASLKERLNTHRLHHTFGVLQSALLLSSMHGGDPGRVTLAALLHDCAKFLEPAEMVKVASRDANIDPVEFGFAPLLHASAGSVIAREEFGIEDVEVLDAIRYHPTGRSEPSQTLIVLMAADYTEPTRNFAGVDEMRAAVRRDLRRGLLHILHNKAQYVHSRGRKLHHRIFEAISSLEGEPL